MARLRLCGSVFAISFCCVLVLTIAQITDPSEVSALLTVKSSLIDPMKHLKNWNKGDPCTSNWKGVLCFNAIGADGHLHVREIQLMNMNLSGSLSPELGQLSHLQILDFMWNGITGSIPKEIGYILSLKLLLLNGNKLSGSLPDELGYLANLNRLQVDLNQICCPIPKSFANLGSIKHLHLNNNSISGHIPSELSNLSTLMHLLLDNNNLSGYLPPELAKLPDLRILQLDNNKFSGADIPFSYGNFSRLVKLSLRNCSLQGAFPDLSRIPNLSYVDLSRNYLTGSLSLNKLADNMTTIDLSDNNLSGPIPISFSYLPSLQKLSLENNFLNGYVTADFWQNKSFSAAARFIIDLRNNSLSNVLGALDPPSNVTLRLQRNPVCSNSNLKNIGQFCGLEAEANDTANSLNNLTGICPIHACPLDNYFEYVEASPVPCFCASPLRIGYRLKSPSFSYFPPYVFPFEMYLTSSLGLELYQLSIESFLWESGPRLRMYLKIFPKASVRGSNTLNLSEILRIRGRFTSWDFPGSDLFGPYELLNFTLLGPYSYANYVTQGKNISKGVVIVIVLSAIACTVTASTILTVFIKRRQARYQHNLSRKKRFGQGGYGKVYKGTLSDNTIVAIKRAKEGSLQGQKEFLTEIEMLSRLHHRNLVSLIGYCDEEGEQMLVYEFMPNGTLQDWLSDNCKESLNFGQRVQVALGSAKGILYLHTEANPPIFHRDIKASNILLDSKLTAKVADFGLSRLAPVLDDEGTIPDHVSTIVKGTPGYLDPEYFLTRKLTEKSDVYSLGVVFLEILTGLRPISQGKNIVREVNLARDWGAMFSIIDSRMGSFPAECVERFVALALRCCQGKPEDRPSMLDVVRELENLLKIMPEIEMSLPEPKSKCFGDSASASSLSSASKEHYVSTSASGSELISNVISTITPR